MLASMPSIAPSRCGVLQLGLAGGNPVDCGDSKCTVATSAYQIDLS